MVVCVWMRAARRRGRRTVCDGGAGAGVPLLLRDTASATAATSTRAAATATDRTSQGSGRPSGGGAGGREGGSAGGVAPGAGTGKHVGRGFAGRSRARRTALSIAPRARRPGVPWAGSVSCPSVIDPPGRDSSRFGAVHARARSPGVRDGFMTCVGRRTGAAAAHPRRIGPVTGGIMRSDLTSGPPAPRGNPRAGGVLGNSDAGADAVAPLHSCVGTSAHRVRLAFGDAWSEPSTPGPWG